MNILLLGSGGREHAFAWKIAQSPLCKNLYIAPGNAGTLLCGTNVNISPNDFKAIREFVLSHKIEMVVSGPEDPLVNGISDFFLSDTQLRHIPVIGPSTQGAMLEGSKNFAKQFLIKHRIPTARYATFSSPLLHDGYRFLESLTPPYVLKADGLAAGKGVIITESLSEAKAELSQMLSGKFGLASRHVVIEEFLSGTELSVFVLTDGDHYQVLPSAKDYKRIGNENTGLNTGGMGAVSPVPFADKSFMQKVESQIIKPTLEGLKKDGIEYKGFLFIGLMNVEGNPYVIEFNCRMGDPETAVVLPRIKNDLVELFIAVANRNLHQAEILADPRFCTTVVLASEGYPLRFETGHEITGLEDVKDCMVFQAGVRLENNRRITSGGRVLEVTAYGDSIDDATSICYREIEKIRFKGKYYRTDIGKDLMAREASL